MAKSALEVIFFLFCLMNTTSQKKSKPSEYYGALEKVVILPTNPIFRGESRKKLENLDQYITQFAELGCFIVINNFEGIDIPNLRRPAVLRFPMLVNVLANIMYDPYFKDQFWLPNYLSPKNKSVPAKNVILQSCKISKYLATFWEDRKPRSWYDYCLRIIQHLFAFASRPWTCEVQFGLFPPLKLFKSATEIQYYPRMFKHEQSWRGYDQLLFLSRPTISILITPKLDDSALGIMQSIIAGTVFRNDYDGLGDSFVSQIIFLHGVVQVGNEIGFPIKESCLLTEIRLLRITYIPIFNPPISGDIPVLVEYAPHQMFVYHNISLAISLSSAASPIESHMWTQSGYLSCVNDGARETDFLSTDMVHKMYNKVLLSILRNYTFKISDKLFCKNGVIKTFKLMYRSVVVNYLYLHLHSNSEIFFASRPMTLKYVESFKNLRFLSCSTLQFESLRFKELIRIYDSWIWSCIATAMILVAATISFMGKQGSYVSSILAVFKVVVGQGDPFMARVLNNGSLRYTAATFLLMGIVLSEGYKNTNMYNIISARKVISMENLSQLVTEKYTVYTRSSEIDFRINDIRVNPEKVIIDIAYSKHFVQPFDGSELLANLRSEVDVAEDDKLLLNASGLHSLLGHYVIDLILKNKNWYLILVLREFYARVRRSNSSLTVETFTELFANKPAVKKAEIMEFQEVYENWERSVPNHTAIARNRSALLVQDVQNWEENTLSSFLQNCSKAALILPEHECVNYAKRLRVNENQHFTIGKVFYPAKPMGLYLEGLIPPVIIKRFKGMEVSGIWEWHLASARKLPDFIKKRPDVKPTKAKMAGNILVIFFVLPVGFFISGAVFGFELSLRKLVQNAKSKSCQRVTLFSRKGMPNVSKIASIRAFLRGILDNFRVFFLNRLRPLNICVSRGKTMRVIRCWTK